MFEKFKHRSYELERLDTGDYTPGEYSRWLREMKVIHRAFGEHRALRSTLLRDIQKECNGRVSVLDVGAGSGELLRELRKWTHNRNAFLAGLEINLHGASLISSNDQLVGLQADALRMPFAAGAFDYVFCSLFLHHLSDGAAAELLAEMKRVARRRIFVVDLNRHPTAYYFFKYLGPLFLQRFTVEDGSLSILRSFTAPELLSLARKAGLKDAKVERSRANRLILSGS